MRPNVFIEKLRQLLSNILLPAPVLFTSPRTGIQFSSVCALLDGSSLIQQPAAPPFSARNLSNLHVHTLRSPHIHGISTHWTHLVFSLWKDFNRDSGKHIRVLSKLCLLSHYSCFLTWTPEITQTNQDPVLMDRGSTKNPSCSLNASASFCPTEVFHQVGRVELWNPSLGDLLLWARALP